MILWQSLISLCTSEIACQFLKFRWSVCFFSLCSAPEKHLKCQKGTNYHVLVNRISECKLDNLQVQVSCFYIQLDTYSHIDLGFIVISNLHSWFVFVSPIWRQSHFSDSVQRKSLLSKRRRERNPYLLCTPHVLQVLCLILGIPCSFSIHITNLCGKQNK